MTVKSAGSDESHIRPGEVQVALPAETGRLALFHRPHPHALDRPQGLPEERPRRPRIRRGLHHRGRSALGARRSPGVETCSHLIVLYWMDRARRDLVVQVPSITATAEPTFALRSPVRPNPIALTVVELRKVEGNTLEWSGSIASTARRCSTSSPISPRPTPSPTPGSAGTRTGRANRR